MAVNLIAGADRSRRALGPRGKIAVRKRPLARLGGAVLAGCVMIAAVCVPRANALDATGPTSMLIRPTDTGLVEGLDGDVLSFLGLPYAAPPVGTLRWRAPEHAAPWSGVRPAKQFSSDCYGSASLREGSLAPGMSEDCLYLNVWTPRGGGSARKPVMVWVYGGGFTGGTAAMPFYDGAALARQGVVVVTLNYRTNVLGFFAHPGLNRESSTNTSGNYGLLDILSALRWVNRNIDSFGGDPTQVTVFGESAGASALGLLLTSPQSRDLFSGAILQSPGLLRPLATLAESTASGRGLDPDLDRLRAMDASSLMAKAQSGLPASRSLKQPRPIGPIVDGWVLPRSDADAIAAGSLVNVPVIIGTNADEGRVFTQRAPVTTVAAYRAYLAAQFGEAEATVEACYPAASDVDVGPAMSRLFGDNQFNRGVDAFAEALAGRDGAIWRYRFDGPPGPGRQPATHGEEIPFVFGVLDSDPLEMFGLLRGGATDADRRVARQMSAAWTAFAKRRDPNVEALPHWPRYDALRATMTFGLSARLELGKATPTGACVAGKVG